ncbi:Deoxynucleoside kinase [Trichostrongylus colubriformis]|uniref:NADH dehydrogenase [ubiquinone] 1 alpha subcomplex subunit 10, mitochondrial n=1 Tax=Trichostrongylus colubriformis TaxID=6319 RepID=A0AAN8FPI1_TRICO
MASSAIKLGRAACRLLAVTTTPIIPQNRSMVHKSVLKLPDDYPDPWPYKEKGYHHIDLLKDKTKPHFHKNSKLIVVEGNIGAGKSTLSAELADQLGLYYMPEFKMEDILIDRYGNDLRNFYHLFPECYRMPDMDMFYKNPMSDMTAKMQQRIFECRFDQFLNAVAHILNTGQGVVLERSPYSDFVFVNAMRSKNFIGHEYMKHYYYVRKHANKQLHFWPHLVIYLDTPVQKCLENIRARGNPNEIAAVDEHYLKVIEESYKDSLKEYKRHSKILAYDWSRPGDADTVVEDIERLDLDFFEWHSGDVMEEWYTVMDEVGWAGWRQQYVSHFS